MVAAAQMGPIQRADDRDDVVERLIRLLHDAHAQGAQLVAFPELALTTFFPRWHMSHGEAEGFYEREMPNRHTKPLFDEAARYYLNMSGEEVLRRYDAGEFEAEIDERPELRHMKMLILFGR